MGGMLAALMSIPGVDPQQQPALADAFSRITAAFSSGGSGSPGSTGSASPGAAAAAAAMAAVATSAALAGMSVDSMGGDLSNCTAEEKARHGYASVARSLTLFPQLLQMPQSFSDLEARMGRIESDMIDAQNGGGALAQRSASAGGAAGAIRELEVLRSRAGRLEHEVAELRTQVARRLDAVSRESALCRREAEDARAEAAALRGEVERLSANLRQAGPERVDECGEKREADTAALPSGVVAPQSTVPLRGDRAGARPASTGMQAVAPSGSSSGALLAPRLPQRSHPGPGGVPLQHGSC